MVATVVAHFRKINVWHPRDAQELSRLDHRSREGQTFVLRDIIYANNSSRDLVLKSGVGKYSVCQLVTRLRMTKAWPHEEKAGQAFDLRNTFDALHTSRAREGPERLPGSA
jgi:hypothetical protein